MRLSDPPRTAPQASPRLSRRGFFAVALAVTAGAGGLAAHWFNIFADNSGSALDPEEAFEAAARGEVLLVDIRRPDEWSLTGVGDAAVALDMRRPDFTQALLQAAGGDASRPIALICARGVRSRQLRARLTEAGFSTVLDVPEGMLGSGAGPGWLARGLPVTFAR